MIDFIRYQKYNAQHTASGLQPGARSALVLKVLQTGQQNGHRIHMAEQRKVLCIKPTFTLCEVHNKNYCHGIAMEMVMMGSV
jgi:hypothetical protein